MKKIIITHLFIISIFTISHAQEKITLSLPDVVEIAAKQSIDAFRNENMYLASYWEFRFFEADRLPSLSLSASPLDFNRYRRREYNFETNEEEFRLREFLNSDLSLSVSQNIGLTGGRLSLRSDFGMIRNLGGEKNTSYSATPVSIGFSQQLNGYNRLKWRSKIEPIKFEKAKKELLQNNEILRIISTTRFFNLINAQIRKGIAEINYANTDTSYRIGQGRYQVGTVTQDELLKLELNWLDAEQALNMASLVEKRALAELNSFLGLPKETQIECMIPSEIPDLMIDADLAVAQALENNPEMLGQEQQILEQNENVDQAKSQTGLNTSLFALYGLSQSTDKLENVYKQPDKSQRFSFGLNIPLVDWGRRKGRLSMAESNRKVALATLRQEKIDFEQNVFQSVLEFNLQADQVRNSAKADTVAQMGYDVVFQRFLIGKIDVIKLNIASKDQEEFRIAYLNKLRDFWISYFNIRSLTLFDFEQNKPLSIDFNNILDN